MIVATWLPPSDAATFWVMRAEASRDPAMLTPSQSSTAWRVRSSTFSVSSRSEIVRTSDTTRAVNPLCVIVVSPWRARTRW